MSPTNYQLPITTPRRRPRPRGILMMEMIIVVLLLAAFMTIISALFVTAYRAQVDSAKRDALFHRVDSALGSLRRDVWSAHKIAYADGHLDLSLTERSNVRWETNEPHRLTRKQTGDTELTQTWIDLPSVDDVNVHGPLVTLTFKENKTRESLTLVSEILLGAPK